jgi:hypothetical protein
LAGGFSTGLAAIAFQVRQTHNDAAKKFVVRGIANSLISISSLH